MFKLSVKLSKENGKLEISIIVFKGYIDFLENGNKIIGEEITAIINQYLKLDKCEICVSLKIEVDDLYETLGKFTKGNEKLDLILSSKMFPIIRMNLCINLINISL